MEDSVGVRVPKPSLLSQLILGEEKRELGRLLAEAVVVQGNLKEGFGKEKEGFERDRRRRKGGEALVEMALVVVVVVVVVVLMRNIIATATTTPEYKTSNFGGICLWPKVKMEFSFDEVPACKLREDSFKKKKNT